MKINMKNLIAAQKKKIPAFIKKLMIFPVFLFSLLLTAEAGNYAKKILPSTPQPPWVENPERALFEPDGELAEIYYASHIDLELSDYAEKLKITTKELWEDRRFGTRTYAVFVKENKDDAWKYIGMSQIGEAGCFNLGQKVKHVRLMYINPYDHLLVPGLLKKVMGVDSIEGLDLD